MTRDELLAALRDDCDGDCEQAHYTHDDLLLEYINDREITEAFNSTTKFYA